MRRWFNLKTLTLVLVVIMALAVPVAALLFGESAGRFLVEVAPANRDAFLRAVKDVPFGQLGSVTGTGRLVIHAASATVIDLPIAAAKSAWQETFKTT